MSVPEIPQHASAAAERASPTIFGTVIAIVAAVATVAVLVFTEPSKTAPPPTFGPDISACEPDGTFCEPSYLKPPAVQQSPASPSGQLSERYSPAG